MKESVFMKTPSKQAEMGRLPVPQGQAGGPSSHLWFLEPSLEHWCGPEMGMDSCSLVAVALPLDFWVVRHGYISELYVPHQAWAVKGHPLTS